MKKGSGMKWVNDRTTSATLPKTKLRKTKLFVKQNAIFDKLLVSFAIFSNLIILNTFF